MRKTGVDHFDLVISSLEHSLPVYRDLLGPLGYVNAVEYDYRPGYYAGFFYDPDGIKLEILHVPD